MDFKEAVKEMNEGKSVRRSTWGDHERLFLNSFISNSGMMVTNQDGSNSFPHIPVHFFCIQINWNFSVWHPNHEAIQAKDWEIISEKGKEQLDKGTDKNSNESSVSS